MCELQLFVALEQNALGRTVLTLVVTRGSRAVSRTMGYAWTTFWAASGVIVTLSPSKSPVQVNGGGGCTFRRLFSDDQAKLDKNQGWKGTLELADASYSK